MPDLCPICCKATKDKKSYEDHYLVDIESYCEEGHYSYDYSYGTSREVIGKNEWIWVDHIEAKDEYLIRRKQRILVVNEIIKGNLDFVIDQSDKEFSWEKQGF